MAQIPENYFEKVYAGWLGKIIGIRLGAAIEGWTYEKIQTVFGDLQDYPVDYFDFAADDDSNGPIFFIRALEDCPDPHNMTSQDVGEALLNYAPFEHGFFWWGGYGISTEHTAYLNLRNGIPAPRSGSIAQNGETVAEQIGGQIFIDSWGLVNPGNPQRAAQYAKKAASVTHDGNGIWGGVFVAVCVSLAFVEQDIKSIMKQALTYLPEDCEYVRVVSQVTKYYEEHPKDWRSCFLWLKDHFGYDRYPGNCHIIPNAGVVALALLYGEGDFSKSITICNMCGWDTDCNVANVGCILGVMNGLSGIEEKWKKPIHDFLACSSVVGSLNAMDIPYGASYYGKLAYLLAGEEIPEPWNTILTQRIDSCHFEYPGSTHSIRFRGCGQASFVNTSEVAFTGNRCLKVSAFSMNPGEDAFFYKKTYYTPEDFTDSRYDPAFSPLLYPGQTVHAAVMIPKGSPDCQVRIYVKEGHTGKVILGTPVSCEQGIWQNLEWNIPPMETGRIDEAGIVCTLGTTEPAGSAVTLYLDDLYFDGTPCYGIDFSKEQEEVWTGLHREISQFTRLKGILELKGEQLMFSCSDFGEAYTGHIDWTDYQAGVCCVPVIGNYHGFNLRVQGAIRSYGAGFWGKGKLALVKNQNGYRVLSEVPFDWQYGVSYELQVRVQGNRITVLCDGNQLIEFEDQNRPYLNGGIGVSVRNGSRCGYHHIQVQGLE
ncbi:MAG: ADP-ribosylglycohydrolase family protein [Massiliimalia sp.]|jgi:ADP-ribosylglycohydrolase